MSDLKTVKTQHDPQTTELIPYLQTILRTFLIIFVTFKSLFFRGFKIHRREMIFFMCLNQTAGNTDIIFGDKTLAILNGVTGLNVNVINFVN